MALGAFVKLTIPKYGEEPEKQTELQDLYSSVSRILSGAKVSEVTVRNYLFAVAGSEDNQQLLHEQAAVTVLKQVLADLAAANKFKEVVFIAAILEIVAMKGPGISTADFIRMLENSDEYRMEYLSTISIETLELPIRVLNALKLGAVNNIAEALSVVRDSERYGGTFLRNFGYGGVQILKSKLIDKGFLVVEDAKDSIESLELSTRVANSLRRNGVNLIDELVDIFVNNPGYLLSFRNFGEESFAEVISKLKEKKYLADDFELNFKEI